MTIGERKPNLAKGFRTRALGTLFHIIKNYLMTTNGIEPSPQVRPCSRNFAGDKDQFCFISQENCNWNRPPCRSYMCSQSEVELRTQGSRPRPRTQKKSEAKAKDSLSEDRPSRGQGQECSRPRPRTKDKAASNFQKKKRSSKKFFRQSPIYRLSQNF